MLAKQYNIEIKWGNRKKKEVKLVEVQEVEEWKVEKILNKRKAREVVKYLVQWKKFTTEQNSQKKKENLENAKKLVAKFEGRTNAEVRRQEKLNLAKERVFRRGKLPEKYIVKMLYRQDNRRFENEYLRKLERNQQNQKRRDKTIWGEEPTSSSRSKNLEGGNNVRYTKPGCQLLYLIFLFSFSF